MLCAISGRLAQSAEHRANNARVVGSSPTLTIFCCFSLYTFLSVFFILFKI